MDNFIRRKFKSTRQDKEKKNISIKLSSTARA
jgi:hypothetical protein